MSQPQRAQYTNGDAIVIVAEDASLPVAGRQPPVGLLGVVEDAEYTRGPWIIVQLVGYPGRSTVLRSRIASVEASNP